MKKLIAVSVLIAACAVSAPAKIMTKTITYKQGDATLEGFLTYDDAVTGKRPGVLVVHQWLGLTDYEKHRAEMLAQLGYVAFCADIYGQDNRPKNVQEAGAEAGKFKSDRQLLRARVNAGLEELKKNELVDPQHIAAIGRGAAYRLLIGPKGGKAESLMEKGREVDRGCGIGIHVLGYLRILFACGVVSAWMRCLSGLPVTKPGVPYKTWAWHPSSPPQDYALSSTARCAASSSRIPFSA